jgi:integrase
MSRGRPPLAIGTWGNIAVRQLGPKKYRARCRFRDYDGAVRIVVRVSESRNKAEGALKEALKGRTTAPGEGDLTHDTKVAALATRWLLDMEDADLSRSTKARYRTIAETFIIPALGDLRLRELTVPAVDRFLRVNRKAHGAVTAKSARSVLSNMVGLAIRHGALTTNPTRDVARISVPKKAARALTVVETKELLANIAADNYADAHDLADLVTFMAATGVRISEACGLRPAQLDLDNALIEINATVTDFGLERRTKSDAGWRVIPIPPSTVELLRRRLNDPDLGTDEVLFPSPLGRVRDTSNTAADLRRVFDRAGFGWVTSHTLRKTVATRLDDAGYSARQIADHLGHAQPSMTQDVYLGRRAANPGLGRNLELP